MGGNGRNLGRSGVNGGLGSKRWAATERRRTAPPPPRLPAPQEPRSPHRSHLFITAPTICSSLILMRAAGALRPLLENAQKNHGNPKNAPKAVKKDPEGKANPAAVRPPAPREPPAPPAPLRHRRCFGFAQNPPNSPQSRPSVPIALSPLLMSANELRPLLIAPLLSAHRPPMRRGVDPHNWGLHQRPITPTRRAPSGAN